MNNKVHIIGITGGSSSGKTYLCNNLMKYFKGINILQIQLDSYYYDLKHLTMKEREKNNFDHPKAFEFNLLSKHLEQIKNNFPTKIPIYDYTNHTRKSECTIIDKEYCLILVEGILSLYDERIRNMMSCCVYIDVPNDIRRERRVKRDLKSRERTLNSISIQYKNTVEPMYKQYIEPTKKYSDILIKEINNKDSGYLELLNKINTIIQNYEK